MNDLLKGLYKTDAEIVVVKIVQVIELVGVAKTEELHQGILQIETAMTTKRISLIPKHKRTKKEGFGRFDRLELIKAIQHASTTSIQSRGTSSES